jgi:hypothetical protein
VTAFPHGPYFSYAQVLNLLRFVDKWTQIRIYLQAVADPEPDVWERSVELLSLWVGRFNATFTQPAAVDTIALTLGDHPKPAIRDHLKTGQL